jgi:hypothetical protein
VLLPSPVVVPSPVVLSLLPLPVLSSLEVGGATSRHGIGRPELLPVPDVESVVVELDVESALDVVVPVASVLVVAVLDTDSVCGATSRHACGAHDSLVAAARPDSAKVMKRWRLARIAARSIASESSSSGMAPF